MAAGRKLHREGVNAAGVVCTWNGVVQNESKETSNEHVCGKKHQNNLVQLFYSFKREIKIYKKGENPNRVKTNDISMTESTTSFSIDWLATLPEDNKHLVWLIKTKGLRYREGVIDVIEII